MTGRYFIVAIVIATVLIMTSGCKVTPLPKPGHAHRVIDGIECCPMGYSNPSCKSLTTEEN